MLAGKRVVVTRSREQAPALADRLAAYGATPILIPAIQFVPLPAEALDAALERIEQYDWLIFTSANGVEFFFRRVAARGLALKLPPVAASGSATAARLAAKGAAVDFIPDEFVGEALVAGLGDLRGKRVLLPRAKAGRPEIARLLREAGALLDEIALYETVMAAPDPDQLAELRRGVDLVIFTSPSSARYFQQILESAGLATLLKKVDIACIGPITAAAVERLGFTPVVVPESYTIDGLVEALNET